MCRGGARPLWTQPCLGILLPQHPPPSPLPTQRDECYVWGKWVDLTFPWIVTLGRTLNYDIIIHEENWWHHKADVTRNAGPRPDRRSAHLQVKLGGEFCLVLFCLFFCCQAATSQNKAPWSQGCFNYVLWSQTVHRHLNYNLNDA